MATLVAVPTKDSESWNYHDKGPAEWPVLCPELCAGSAQTPINIEPAATVKLEDPQLRLDYDRSTSISVFNSTHSVQAATTVGSARLTFGGDTYSLVQFHFHTPSEHELGGDSFPIELHLVHASRSGDLAVVGVFIEQGARDRELGKIWRDLPTVGDARTIEIDDFDVRRLLPKGRRAYHYMGSLTTPPCTEGVTWFVFEDSKKMSQGQIEAFVDIFSGVEFPEGNSRPVQPLNGRTVYSLSY